MYAVNFEGKRILSKTHKLRFEVAGHLGCVLKVCICMQDYKTMRDYKTTFTYLLLNEELGEVM